MNLILDFPALPGAACTTGDPDEFFPDGPGNHGADAKKVCDGCPARTPCLTWALEHNERYGVWGGLGPDEREQLRGGKPTGHRFCLDCPTLIPSHHKRCVDCRVAVNRARTKKAALARNSAA